MLLLFLDEVVNSVTLSHLAVQELQDFRICRAIGYFHLLSSPWSSSKQDYYREGKNPLPKKAKSTKAKS